MVRATTGGYMVGRNEEGKVPRADEVGETWTWEQMGESGAHMERQAARRDGLAFGRCHPFRP